MTLSYVAELRSSGSPVTAGFTGSAALVLVVDDAGELPSKVGVDAASAAIDAIGIAGSLILRADGKVALANESRRGAFGGGGDVDGDFNAGISVGMKDLFNERLILAVLVIGALRVRG